MRTPGRHRSFSTAGAHAFQKSAASLVCGHGSTPLGNLCYSPRDWAVITKGRGCAPFRSGQPRAIADAPTASAATSTSTPIPTRTPGRMLAPPPPRLA